MPRAPRKKGALARKPLAPKDWKARFIEALAETGVVGHAVKIANTTYGTVYLARKKDAEFAEAWDVALELAIDGLEIEARRRALSKSDLLLMFLLKGWRPDKYRDNAKIEHAGKIEGGAKVVVYIPDDGRDNPDGQ